MAQLPPPLPQGDLQPLCLVHRPPSQQVVDGAVAAQEGQAVDQLKPFLGQVALRTQPGDAQASLVNQLQGQPRLDVLAGLLAPVAQQTPTAQTQVLRHEQPQADQVAADLVAENLPYTAFNTKRICW